MATIWAGCMLSGVSPGWAGYRDVDGAGDALTTNPLYVRDPTQDQGTTTLCVLP